MYQRILVPLDGSATADKGLREAIALAASQKARLFLLHVVDDYPMLLGLSSVASCNEMIAGLRKYGTDVLDKAKQAARDASVEAETLLTEVATHRVAEVIVQQARRRACDLIVMGTHGRRGLDRVALGSEAELVVRTSPVPVLLVRPEPAQPAP